MSYEYIKEEEQEHIRNGLKANGYPRHIINRNYSIVPNNQQHLNRAESNSYNTVHKTSIRRN